MKAIAAFVAIVLLTVPAFAKDTWEDRLRKELEKSEAVAAKLDGKKAKKNVKLEERIEALHQRVAALEAAREMPTPPLTVETKDASSRLMVLSKAVLGLGSRLRKVKKHDSPPAVTPSKPSKSPKPKPKDPKDPKGPVQWPEMIEVKATSSLDYESFGEWEYRVLYPTRWDRKEYRLLGYEGRFHLSLRLVGLLEEVKSVDVVVIVGGGTGPFKFKKRPRYEIRWRARHRHMWNGALKQWGNYDTWTQDVRPRWGGYKGKTALRPSVTAFLSQVTTKEGRVINFKVPK